MAIFGSDHLGALAGLALVGWVIVRHASGAAFRRCFAMLLLAAELIDPIVLYSRAQLTWARGLPLELCDLAAVATAAALWTKRQAWFEYAWLWGLSGTLQALLTPTLDSGFPSPDYFRFFLLHGGIVLGALHLFGRGMRMRRGAALRIYGVTAAYTVMLMAFDFLVDANYMFLRRKPAGSILEPFGPWPLYVFGGAAIAAGLFWLLARAARDPAPA
jgi:hypothetical integral membrane protein (TIGR02206 family)